MEPAVDAGPPLIHAEVADPVQARLLEEIGGCHWPDPLQCLGPEASRLYLGDGDLLVSPDLAQARLTTNPARPLSLDGAFGYALAHAFLQKGGLVIHAAAVELEGTALLVIGPARSGKSTLTAALLACGGRVVSDDALLLGLDPGGRFRVAGLRPYLQFRRGTPSLLDGPLQERLQRHVIDGEARWRLYRDRAPTRFLDIAAPQRLLLLTPDPGGSTTLDAPESRAGALLEVSAASLFKFGPLYTLSPTLATRAFHALSRLCNDLPVAKVRLGEDLLRAPERVARELMAGRHPLDPGQ